MLRYSRSKMRKGMSVSVIDTDETQYSQEEQLQA